MNLLKKIDSFDIAVKTAQQDFANSPQETQALITNVNHVCSACYGSAEWISYTRACCSAL